MTYIAEIVTSCLIPIFFQKHSHSVFTIWCKHRVPNKALLQLAIFCVIFIKVHFCVIKSFNGGGCLWQVFALHKWMMQWCTSTTFCTYIPAFCPPVGVRVRLVWDSPSCLGFPTSWPPNSQLHPIDTHSYFFESNRSGWQPTPYELLL